jgi:DNA invertase Pin-like site-specific DNA recombinase
MMFGYARVSTPQQSLENQVALLKDAGCEKIFSEKISGYNCVKGEFDKMMEFVRAKDVVVVTGVDRLGRSTKDLTILLDEFHNREIDLVILGHDIDTRTAHGKMMFGFMAIFAENERNRNLERIRQGMEGARKRGRHIGRPNKLKGDKIKQMVNLYKSQALSVKELCLMYGVCKVTLYKYVRKDGKTLNLGEDERSTA